ncbi:hypothetical protein EDB80DRAFT_537998, partial [Ilyonectria destructans]
LDPMDPQSSSRVTLQKPGDWNRWVSVIRKEAKAADVWQFIDPSKIDKEPLKAPPTPTAQDADPSMTLVKDLSPEKVKILDALLQQHSTEFKLYRDKVKALGAIQRLISKTVGNYESTIEGEDEDDIAKQLLLLKNKTHSTDWNKEDTILTQFQGILKSPERTNLSQWVIRWQKVLTEAQKINLPDVQGIRPTRLFLKAVSDINPDFTGYWFAKIEDLASNDGLDWKKEIPDGIKISNMFERHTSQLAASKAAFSSFQGIQP